MTAHHTTDRTPTPLARKAAARAYAVKCTTLAWNMCSAVRTIWREHGDTHPDLSNHLEDLAIYAEDMPTAALRSRCADIVAEARCRAGLPPEQGRDEPPRQSDAR